MNRNIQVKVVLIFFVLGILLIASLGMKHIYMLQELQSIQSNEPQMVNILQEQMNQTKLIMVIATGVYMVISTYEKAH